MRICAVTMYHHRDDFVQICILEKGADQSQPRKLQIMSCISDSAKLLGLPGSGATETILSGALQPNTLEVPETNKHMRKYCAGVTGCTGRATSAFWFGLPRHARRPQESVTEQAKIIVIHLAQPYTKGKPKTEFRRVVAPHLFSNLSHCFRMQQRNTSETKNRCQVPRLTGTSALMSVSKTSTLRSSQQSTSAMQVPMSNKL